MNARTMLLGTVAALSLPTLLPAVNIDKATFTEVVNSVSVINAGTKRSSPAKLQQSFNAPNVLRTGADSRAEMTAEDSTVTRVGQNTLFSFTPNSREIELQKGSILFQSPTGKGGGTIRTPAASAAVLGTTLIVTTTKNGGFKVLVVEGKGSVKTSTGKFRRLGAGQMVYALPGGELSNTFEFRLSQQVGASRLVGGFKKPLASAAKIQAALAKQEKEIAEGKATATNLLATGSPNFAIKVDVARETMVRQAAPTAEEVAALDPLASDAIIDQATLDSTRVNPATTPFTAQFFRAESDLENGSLELAVNPSFFVGNNVIFDTPTVDLNPFLGNDLLRFLAVQDLTFRQTVDLGSLPNTEIQFVAGRTLLNEPGISVLASAQNLAFVALGSTFPLAGNGIVTPQDISTDVPLTLTNFAVGNRTGGIVFLAGDAHFTDVQLGAQTTIDVVARRDVSMRSEGTVLVTFEGGAFRERFISPSRRLSALTAGSQVRIAAGRDLSLERTSIASGNTILKAERNVRLSVVDIRDGRAALPSFFQSEGEIFETGPRSVTITSQQLADLRNVNVFANDVFVQSNTVRLENVQFRDGSRVVLESRVGVLAPSPNSNQPVRAGFVNFVDNVSYGNQPAQEAVVQNGPSSEPSERGAGIVIRPIGGGRARPSTGGGL